MNELTIATLMPAGNGKAANFNSNPDLDSANRLRIVQASYRESLRCEFSDGLSGAFIKMSRNLTGAFKWITNSRNSKASLNLRRNYLKTLAGRSRRFGASRR